MNRASLTGVWAAVFAAVLSACCLAAAPGQASIVEFDEIIFQGEDTPDPDALSGRIDMDLTGDDITGYLLTVTLTNTSEDTLSQGAMNILTGLGFVLPAGVSISGGSVTIQTGSTAVYFSAPDDGDVSQEWGYENLVNQGPFFAVPLLPVNTAVNSLVASVDHQFADGSLDKSPGVSGPDFGLLMDLADLAPAKEASVLVGKGTEAIQDSVVIDLNLSGIPDNDLVKSINEGHVVLSFGSPNTSSIPEPASFVVWFLIGLSWAGSAWRYQYRCRWKKWQQEDIAAAGMRGQNQADRFRGSGGQLEQQVGIRPAGRWAAHRSGH